MAKQRLVTRLLAAQAEIAFTLGLSNTIERLLASQNVVFALLES
jgi:hypothetical protein